MRVVPDPKLDHARAAHLALDPVDVRDRGEQARVRTRLRQHDGTFAREVSPQQRLDVGGCDPERPGSRGDPGGTHRRLERRMAEHGGAKLPRDA